MSYSRQILDAVKARYTIQSDYALADFLGMTRSWVSAHRRTDAPIEEGVALKCAGLVKIDAGLALAWIRFDSSLWRGERDLAAAWLSVIERLNPGRIPVSDLAEKEKRKVPREPERKQRSSRPRRGSRAISPQEVIKSLPRRQDRPRPA